MMKLEISKSLRAPILFGWKIDDPDNEDLLGIVKLVESLGISFVVFDLNRLSRKLDSIPQGSEAGFQETISALSKNIHSFWSFVPIGRSDLALSTELWSTRVVSFIKTNSFQSLKTQLDWSCYVSVRAIIIDLESILTSQLLSENLDVLDRLVQFCQVISSYLRNPNLPTLWVSLDCCNQSWNTWYMIYELCNFSDKLKVCLKLLPLETEIAMWQSEPVKCVILSETAIIRTNTRVRISKEVTNYLTVLMKNNVKIVLDSNLNFHQLYSQYTLGTLSTNGGAGLNGAGNAGSNPGNAVINSEIVNFNSTVSNMEVNGRSAGGPEGVASNGLEVTGRGGGGAGTEMLSPITTPEQNSGLPSAEHSQNNTAAFNPGTNNVNVSGAVGSAVNPGMAANGPMGVNGAVAINGGANVTNTPKIAKRIAPLDPLKPEASVNGSSDVNSVMSNGDMAVDEELNVRDLLKAIKKIYTKLGPLTVNELYGRGYEDVLQIPLQPLRDNLDSNTYNEFEKCTFKYYSYHLAIDGFLKACQTPHALGFASSMAATTAAAPLKVTRSTRSRTAMAANGSSNGNPPVVSTIVSSGIRGKGAEKDSWEPELALDVYIVGAGRGPLVEVSLEVLKKNKITNFTIHAIDKNPYTMLTLQDKMARNGWTNVRLVCSDMRKPLLASPAGSNELNAGGSKKDKKHNVRREILVVSELLGPFGDNELAPECLYGFERNFAPEDRVHFIPQNYTSYVMPVHAPQIWAKIKNLSSFKHFHMPYTVHLKSFYSVAHEYMPCFKFTHPSSYFTSNINAAARGSGKSARRDREEDGEELDRYRVLKFVALSDCYVHGFGAYFRCTLFGQVQLSILPHESENIKSWFPMFFPVEIPFPVKKSQTITFHIWRKSDDLRVWYEWAFTTPATTSIHNVNGFAYHIAKQ